ncbi:MAG: TonB-dependent receptor [Gammaproteobacteria bacterium]|nr:TonB-dependent receptor [Gammaproteobacteria bacterium]
MKRSSSPIIVVIIAAALALAGTAAAQSTTSTLRIITSDDAGTAAGVPVQITHMPTGRVQTFATNEVGAITVRGLAVGGPYVVQVVSGSGFSGQTVSEIYLELDRTEQISLQVQRERQMEEVVATGQQVGRELRVGVGEDFSAEKIQATPSISRDFISTLATDPKILVDNSVARGPAVSIAGQNFRFNSVTIDGVAQNDNFGLSKNASATQRSPISIDAVQEINVNVAPFDVTYGNFIGGNINIVTKSGTNDFHGSVFGFTTGDSFTGDKSDGVDVGVRDFDEDVYGFTLGGPIVKDKLFFFANYEKFETTLPSNSQTIEAIAGVTQADVDRAISIFQDEYGFDPGRFDASDTDQDEKYLLKIDWNINDRHRAVASYQVADGDVLFDDFPEVAVLQSNRYNINEKLTAFSAQAFSDWNDRLSTEVKVGFKDVENRQISVDPTTPDFSIAFEPFGPTRIAAGGDRFRHTNELDNKSRLIKLKADYEMGNHTITAGFEQEQYEIRNLFLPFSKGNYVFFSLDDLENRVPGFVLYGNSNTGIAKDAEANFELAVNSVYIQDEWNVTDDLVLKFGLRQDNYSNDDPIPLNSGFQARNGFDNTENLDDKDILLPRLGFNWDATDRLTLRGGAGLFGGGTPLIMLSNSYSGNGVTRTFAQFLAPFFGPPVSDSIDDAVAALPDTGAAFDNFQQYIGFDPDTTAVDAFSPDFKPLSTWKFSVGADYNADLSRIGLGDDWDLSFTLVHSSVNNGYDIYEGRRRVVATAPDGRPIYDAPPEGDYIVRNTSLGGGQVYTFDAAKTFETGLGLFDTTFGYTYQDMDEVRSYNRFVGFETYAFDPQSDLNNPSVATGRYQTDHRVTSTLAWEKDLFGDNTTSLGLVYIGRSGPKYSYVFGSQNIPTFGGTFLSDFGSEADNPGPQLFYVPTGTGDPIITGDPDFLADLNTFIDRDECLRGARGSIVTRNSCETDWVHTVNLRLVQEFGFMEDKNIELILDIENFLNFINDDWGRVESYTAPSNVAPAAVALSADGSQYILSPSPGYAGTPESIIPQPSIARLPSVYRIQFGFRFSF